MKIKNFFMLIKASVFSRKLSTGLFCFFIILSTVIILLSVCLIFPLRDNIENKINNHIFNRELSISFSSNTPQQDIDKDLSAIKEIEHISDIYLKPDVISVREKSGALHGEYTLDFLHNGYSINITLGRVFDETETSVAIVPEEIRVFNNANNKIEKINGEDLIGKNLEFSYGGENTYDAVVVGTYNISDPMFSGTQIIIPQKDLLKCNDKINEKIAQSGSTVAREIKYTVLVDSYKNTDKAASDISLIRQAAKEQTLGVDAESYNIALILLFAVLLVFIIMVISGLFIFLQNSVKNRTNELALYRSLGYKSKHLFSIVFIEHLFFGIISILYGAAITVLLNYLVVNPYLYSLVGNTLMEMTANVSVVDILCLLVFFIIILSIVCRSAVKRSEKIDLTVLLRER